MEREYYYEVKCRKCQTNDEYYFGKVHPKDFAEWISIKSTSPLINECEVCNQNTIMDLISYMMKE